MERKNNLSFPLFCLACAGVFLLFCSKSSPLYPMNDWVDVNCFFTMGRSMLDGKVPYRDLYEQKGPILYFFYAFLSLFGRHTFFGVYLAEVVTYGAFLYLSGKIARLYLGNSLAVYYLVALEGGLIAVSMAFAHGASVEEMCLFCSAYGLYVVLKAQKEGRFLSFWEAFFCGLCAAVLLWVKYTMLGLYLGLAIFIALWYLIQGFQCKKLLTTIGGFFAGMGAVSAVVVLYFAAKGALGDLWTVYFYNNIFLYPREAETSRLQAIWQSVQNMVAWNPWFSRLFLPGLAWALWRCFRHKGFEPSLLALCFFGLALGTYWGGWSMPYYGLVFAVFAVFGLIPIFRLLQWLWGKAKLTPHTSLVWYFLPVAVLGMTFLCVKNSRNTYLMRYAKEDLPQYKFAETIRAQGGKSLMNYGFLDGGFYYASGIEPEGPFFCTLNVQAPEMWDAQSAAITEGKVDFFVTRTYLMEHYWGIRGSDYRLVQSASMYFEGVNFTYYLYQKNP